jgi:hypothetical protein
MELALADAGGAKASDENACRADERQDDGGIFRRIDAAGLGAERKSGEERSGNADGKKSAFHVGRDLLTIT